MNSQKEPITVNVVIKECPSCKSTEMIVDYQIYCPLCEKKCNDLAQSIIDGTRIY